MQLQFELSSKNQIKDGQRCIGADIWAILEFLNFPNDEDIFLASSPRSILNGEEVGGNPKRKGC